nr:MAG TPA: zinc protease [Caudoviricetes sp.]
MAAGLAHELIHCSAADHFITHPYLIFGDTLLFHQF